MRNKFDPNDEYDVKTAKRLKAKPWMLELLDMNPDYNGWGPGEDYMPGTSGGKGGWASSQAVKTWKEFSWELDDLNECVNFHFEIERSAQRCQDCDGEGYNPETTRISQAFYNLDDDPALTRWCDKITQDELDALIEEGRIKKGTPLDLVNEANGNHRRGFFHEHGVTMHDAINRHILIKARATRLGVFGLCPTCNGHGNVFVEDEPRMTLVLWILHPRKGAARGVVVERIEREDLPEVFQWLRLAAERNAMRFSRIPDPGKVERKRKVDDDAA